MGHSPKIKSGVGLSWKPPKGGFPLMAEITRCHNFAKEINRASARSQYSDENFYGKNVCECFCNDRKADLSPGSFQNIDLLILAMTMTRSMI